MMAKRFSGRFSPDISQAGTPSGQAKHQDMSGPKTAVRPSHGARRIMLTLPAILIAIKAFFGGAGSLALFLSSSAILFLALWLLREGLRAEAAYDVREVANRPAIPRKIFAAVLWGLGLGIAVLTQGGAFPALIIALIGMLLHLAAFGVDPLKSKGLDRVDARQFARADRILTEAEHQVITLRDMIKKINDRDVETNVDTFCQTALQMIERLQDDPRDVRGARKFLGVYLESTVTATTGYITVQNSDPEGQKKSAFIELLSDLNANFAQKTETFIANDKADLQVEMDVLRQRLAHENLAPRD